MINGTYFVVKYFFKLWLSMDQMALLDVRLTTLFNYRDFRSYLVLVLCLFSHFFSFLLKTTALFIIIFIETKSKPVRFNEI